MVPGGGPDEPTRILASADLKSNHNHPSRPVSAIPPQRLPCCARKGAFAFGPCTLACVAKSHRPARTRQYNCDEQASYGSDAALQLSRLANAQDLIALLAFSSCISNGKSLLSQLPALRMSSIPLRRPFAQVAARRFTTGQFVTGDERWNSCP